jgi:hypothetical protein
MWFRIVYTTLLTIASRWIFVKSNFSSPSWHIHNTGMISAFIGMWLLTITSILDARGVFDIEVMMHFNTLAHNFWLSGLPSYALFLLAYFLIFEKDGNMTQSQLNWLIIFDMVMGNILLLD